MTFCTPVEGLRLLRTRSQLTERFSFLNTLYMFKGVAISRRWNSKHFWDFHIAETSTMAEPQKLQNFDAISKKKYKSRISRKRLQLRKLYYRPGMFKV